MSNVTVRLENDVNLYIETTDADNVYVSVMSPTENRIESKPFVQALFKELHAGVVDFTEESEIGDEDALRKRFAQAALDAQLVASIAHRLLAA